MSEINRIIQDLEFCDGVFDYTLTPDDSGLLLGYIQELQQENQQLKQKYEMQKDSNKLLCKAIICDDCDCKVCEAHKQNIKYKSVLDEIREYIGRKRRNFIFSYGVGNEFIREYDDLLEILDKVKE